MTELDDNEIGFRAAIIEDLELTSGGPVSEAIIMAVESFIEGGYIEGQALRDRYRSFICPKCGRIHEEDCRA